MFLTRLFGRKRSTPIKIAAGSTAQFPVISHTFVYQELIGFHEMCGAEVRLFHTEQGDPAALHHGFGYLDDNRLCFESSWDRHVADFEYYRSTRPERVNSLLQALHEASGMPRAELEQRYELMLAFTYTRLVEEWEADYIHTYFFYDQALNGLVASWVLDLPRGLSTYADHMMNDWPLKVVSLHLRTADVIVATSRRIASELDAIGGPEIRPRVIVKPNGVDARRFPFVERRPANGRPVELICVSRVEPKKGMLELADAAKLLRERGQNVRIHVIGGADRGSVASEAYAAEFAQRIDDNGVGDRLLCHGSMRQEEMRPLFERADAFIAPFVETESGDKDGIPTAILEGMSTGLPIIATDAGSIPEIIDDGREGFVVEQRNPAALAAAIARLVESPALAPQLGRAARVRFEREFDVQATEPRLHDRVRGVLRQRAQARA